MATNITPIQSPTVVHRVQPLHRSQALDYKQPQVEQPEKETATQVRYDKLSTFYARKNDIDTAKQIVGERELKKIGALECTTCSNRTYKDQSSDPGVSMKSPTKVSPEAAGAVVRSHENEHVVRNAAKAEQEGREVVFSNVQIFTGVCNECGRVYVSGGKTTTMTSGKTQQAIAAGLLNGLQVDEEG